MKLITNGRYLSYENGEPFFYAGDTAWELFHRLNKEDALYYLDQRRVQGFNAVQAVVLSEFDGLLVPNAYGRIPFFIKNEKPDPLAPDLDGEYSYWEHVDFILQEAAKRELFIVLLPTWGDKFNIKWGKGPVIFDPQNAYEYGKWIGRRYADHWNVIWMLGGDRAIETAEHRAIIDGMAKGIKENDPNHLMTFHPQGCTTSIDSLQDPAYIDFHTSQTGHATDQCYVSHQVMQKMASETAKPYLDSESRYEDHPACFNDKLGYYWDAADTRQNTYWNLMAGACGQTYGNHCIWSMNSQAGSYFPYLWKEAIHHPGAQQFGYAKKLRLSRDYFSFKPTDELLVENYPSMGHMNAGMGRNYAYIYSPLGLPFRVNTQAMNARILKASWFDPRTGEENAFAILPGGCMETFAPPTQGKGQDWVLILDVME